MKFIKYFLFGIVLLFAIFILLGVLKPSVEYGHEIIVDKPVEEAWAITQDDSKYHLWLDGFKSIELISGEHAAVGSKYKVTVKPGEGQPDFEMTETVISIKENDHVALHFDSEMMDFEQIISVSNTDGKTSVKTESKVIGKGMMMRSMFAMMEMLGGTFQAQEEKNIEALKVVINSNTTVY